MRTKSTKYWIIAFLAPSIILFISFYVYSIGTVAVTGFTNWKLGGKITFAGVHNFTTMFQDEVFIQALKNTIIWLILHWTVLVGTSILMAFVTMKKSLSSKIIKVIYLIPTMIPLAVVGFLSYFVFNPTIGIVNNFINVIGFKNFSLNWFQNQDTAFLTVTLTSIFFGGVYMLLISSEMAAIPADIFEAAKIDGASDLKIKIYIILPLIRNIIGTTLILATVQCLKTFEVIYLTTSGGPGNLTMNLPIMIFRTAMNNSNYGYANAIALITIVIGAIAMGLISKIFSIGKDK